VYLICVDLLLLMQGVMKMTDDSHLRAAAHKFFFDLGCGTGKLCLQVFLSFLNVVDVKGVEIAPSRYGVAEAALLRLLATHRKRFRIHTYHKGVEIAICEDAGSATCCSVASSSCVSTGGQRCRVLSIRRCNMFDVPADELSKADMIIMETDLPESKHPHLCKFISTGVRPNARMLTYLNMREIWPLPSHPLFARCDLRQVNMGANSVDRFATSWAYTSGHHFFLWEMRVSSRRNGLQLQRLMGWPPCRLATDGLEAARAPR
jgi:SAM-dependent methyltransferase